MNAKALLALVAIVAALCAPVARAQDTPRPNFIFVLVDDMGRGDLSCYGQENWTTPNLDRMAAEGLRFTDAYAGSTVCAPSRATLLTGMHTGNVYQRGNGDIQFPEDPEEITIATLLKRAGYETAMIGKSGVACDSTDAGLPTRKGFDHFFGLLSHRAAHRQYPEFLYRNGERIRIEGNEGYTGEQYASELFVEDALDWIGAHRGSPFFLHLSLTPPHADLVAPERYTAPFRGKFDETNNDKSGYLFQPEPAAAYAGMVAFIDESVGRLLDRLEELGLDENTVVFFASDNGPHREGGARIERFDSNGPFRGGKRDLYEGGIRTPQIAWGPGLVPAGGVTDFPTAFWDVGPTMLDLAQTEIPDWMDGISIVPTMRGQDQPGADRVLYWEFHEQGGKQAIRRGDWKAVRLGVGRDPDGPVQLFNLAEDPGERSDIADERPEIAAELAELMRSSRTESAEFRFGAN